MSRPDPAKIRADLARGHLLLGELEQAHVCLVRLVADAPDHEGLEELLRALIEECEVGAPQLLEAARELHLQVQPEEVFEPEPELEPVDEDPAPVSAPTPERSSGPLHVAEIARLEAWLAGVRRRYAAGGAHDVS